MTVLSKLEVEEKIMMVIDLDLEGLHRMAHYVSLSDIDHKARTFINRAIDMRIKELEKYENAMLQHAEYNLDEFDDI